MNKVEKNAGLIIIVLILIELGAIGTIAYNYVQFDRHCSGYLKRAADANSVELAAEEVEKALKYCRREGYDHTQGRSRGMHDGYTSILYTTPDEEIKFWYDNLQACELELAVVCVAPQKVTALERSNILMKLRETLLDDIEGGTSVTYPPGLVVYPYNLEFAIWIWAPWILFVGFLVYLKISE